MLPPIPHSLQPVTAQQDVPKPRPEIADQPPLAAVRIGDWRSVVGHAPSATQTGEKYQ